MGVRKNPEDWEKWKCGKLPTGRNLVSGIMQYETCHFSRSSVLAGQCGQPGHLFHEYEKPVYGPLAPGKVSVDTLFEELENLT